MVYIYMQVISVYHSIYIYMHACDYYLRPISNKAIEHRMSIGLYEASFATNLIWRACMLLPLQSRNSSISTCTHKNTHLHVLYSYRLHLYICCQNMHASSPAQAPSALLHELSEVILVTYAVQIHASGSIHTNTI